MTEAKIDMNYEGYSLENVPYYESGKFWVSPMNFVPEAMDTSDIQEEVIVHDVTLRDGEQTPGVVFTTQDRIEMAKVLSELGVDRIEFGMPIASKDTYEAFEEVLKMDLKAEIVSFCRAHPDDLELTIKLGCKTAIIEHIINPYMLKHVYGLDHKATVERCVNALKIAQQAGIKASFMGWDASRTNMEYLKRFYSDILDQTEMESLIFVDTFGVMNPWSVFYTIKTLRSWFPGLKLEIHNHNGFGLGTANAMAAVLAGVNCVHGAVLGLGERDGNIPIDEIAMMMALQLKKPTNIDLSQLNRVTKLAEQISGFKPSGTKPITGDYYFKMAAGISIHAIEKAREAGLGDRVWAAFAPEMIGKKDYEYLLGKANGTGTMKIFLERLGINASKEQMQDILEIVKKQANLVKGNVSEVEFEYIARKYFAEKVAS
jgi:isopropylmalate/homocitrate/citramalate synthase